MSQPRRVGLRFSDLADALAPFGKSSAWKKLYLGREVVELWKKLHLGRREVVDTRQGRTTQVEQRVGKPDENRVGKSKLKTMTNLTTPTNEVVSILLLQTDGEYEGDQPEHDHGQRVAGGPQREEGLFQEQPDEELFPRHPFLERRLVATGILRIHGVHECLECFGGRRAALEQLGVIFVLVILHQDSNGIVGFFGHGCPRPGVWIK